MKKPYIFILLFLLLFAVSCESIGFIDKNTYQAVVKGTWSRRLFYTAGTKQTKNKIDKTAKSIDFLKQAARVKAEAIALKEFKRKLVMYIELKTGERSGKYYSLVRKALKGAVIKTTIINEVFTDSNDIKIVCNFEVKGLKKIIEGIAAGIIESNK